MWLGHHKIRFFALFFSLFFALPVAFSRNVEFGIKRGFNELIRTKNVAKGRGLTSWCDDGWICLIGRNRGDLHTSSSEWMRREIALFSLFSLGFVNSVRLGGLLDGRETHEFAFGGGRSLTCVGGESLFVGGKGGRLGAGGRNLCVGRGNSDVGGGRVSFGVREIFPTDTDKDIRFNSTRHFCNAARSREDARRSGNSRRISQIPSFMKGKASQFPPFTRLQSVGEAAGISPPQSSFNEIKGLGESSPLTASIEGVTSVEEIVYPPLEEEGEEVGGVRTPTPSPPSAAEWIKANTQNQPDSSLLAAKREKRSNHSDASSSSLASSKAQESEKASFREEHEGIESRSPTEEESDSSTFNEDAGKRGVLKMNKSHFSLLKEVVDGGIMTASNFMKVWELSARNSESSVKEVDLFTTLLEPRAAIVPGQMTSLTVPLKERDRIVRSFQQHQAGVIFVGWLEPPPEDQPNYSQVSLVGYAGIAEPSDVSKLDETGEVIIRVVGRCKIIDIGKVDEFGCRVKVQLHQDERKSFVNPVLTDENIRALHTLYDRCNQEESKYRKLKGDLDGATYAANRPTLNERVDILLAELESPTPEEIGELTSFCAMDHHIEPKARCWAVELQDTEARLDVVRKALEEKLMKVQAENRVMSRLSAVGRVSQGGRG